MKNVSLEVLFNGRPAKIHKKDGRLYLEGREGSEYRLKVTNDNNYRVLAIVGVDGINIINGEQNTKDSPGYLVDKYSSITLDGYRLNNDECALFKFTKKGDSYASSKTIVAQNGIISLDAYKEYQKPEPIVIKEKEYISYIPYNPRPIWWDYGTPVFPQSPYITWTCGELSSTHAGLTSEQNGQFRSCNNISAQNLSNGILESKCELSNSLQCPSDHFELGSSFGSVKESKVVNVDFVKGDYLGEINIYYTTRERLIEIGVELTTRNKITYPKGTSGFCQPPPNWKR